MTTDPEARLCVSGEKLDELFDLLRQRLKDVACDDTLGFTRQWAESANLPVDSFERGLARLGARCDCQVIIALWLVVPDTKLPYAMLI